MIINSTRRFELPDVCRPSYYKALINWLKNPLGLTFDTVDMLNNCVVATLLLPALETVGIFTLAYYLTRFLYMAHKTFRALFLSSRVVFKSYGQWAVVTGATDGIGKAYAEQLAEKGMDVVLISRSIDKLHDVASNIERTYKVNTKVISADFSCGREIYPAIAPQLDDLDVGVLVNNVGMFVEYPEYFHLVPNKEELCAAMINCNVRSVTAMTSIVLPQMVRRKKGIVINISSASAIFNMPLWFVYPASKSYITILTKSLQIECALQGIVVQNVSPFFMATKLVKNVRNSFTVPEASACVRSALNSVGVLDDTFGCLCHWLQACLLSALPVRLSTAGMLRMVLDARSAALRNATPVEQRE